MKIAPVMHHLVFGGAPVPVMRDACPTDGRARVRFSHAFLATLAVWLVFGLVGHDPWKPDEADTFGRALWPCARAPHLRSRGTRARRSGRHRVSRERTAGARLAGADGPDAGNALAVASTRLRMDDLDRGGSKWAVGLTWMGALWLRSPELYALHSCSRSRYCAARGRTSLCRGLATRSALRRSSCSCRAHSCCGALGRSSS